jgi:UDP-N-acetylglucosamine diphosphorylase/glucosamine-1-phosphate N-acetyltransferase
MNFVLYDLPQKHQTFLPFTFSRPVSEIRIGILTIREKWEKMLGTKVCYHTVPYLSEKFKGPRDFADNFIINSSVLPNTELVKSLIKLEFGQSLYVSNTWVATRTKDQPVDKFEIPEKTSTSRSMGCEILNHPWEIFTLNDSALQADFDCVTLNRKSEKLSDTNRVIAPENIFIEKGATVEHCILNASTGPIYIGKDARMLEGCMVRGPLALCEGAVLKMGAKIYGATTIGPFSKVGGEVNNSVIFGYSNKSHDGYLGNSVLGEWCNLGADTNNSNLKNNYGEVSIYSYEKKDLIATGLTFCGLFMADHSKCGINTMFNTGTVVGFSCNVFGSGFPDKHLRSFTWGGAETTDVFKLEKAVELAKAVFSRRNMNFSNEDEKLFSEIFKLTVLQKN